MSEKKKRDYSTQNRSGQVVGMRLLMLYQFIQAHASKTRAVTRQEIEEHLSSRGFKTERRTLYSDLLALETYFGLELEYDPHKKGYILKNPPFEPYELRLMVDCIQSSKFITAEISRKISAKIKTLADKETVATLNRQAQVSDRVRSMNESVVKDADRIHAAIASDSKISFRYFHYSPDKNKPKSYSKSGEQYIVSPFALLWNDGNYYLYAYVSENERFQIFRVDRMECIMPPLLEKRDGKELYRAESLTVQKAKVFGMFHGEAHRVHMRILNRFADAIIEQFGKETILVPEDNEHFTTTVYVEISPPFFAWVSTFGKGIKILSPEPVIEGMKKFIEDVSEMYKDEETSGKA